MRITDPADVLRVFGRPDVWPWISEDGASVADFQPDMARSLWLSVGLGVMEFRPWSAGWWDVHIAMPPKQARPDVLCRQAFEWVREKFGALGFVARIPGENIAAFKLAQRLGFEVCGRVRGCISRGGVLMDLILMELQYGRGNR